MTEEKKDTETNNIVFKVLDCTFAREEMPHFYLCNCKSKNQEGNSYSKEEFFPICEACMKTCHKQKEHKSIKHEGRYDCKCGETNHKEREITNNEDNECFYRKLLSKTGKQNLIESNGTAYCKFCIDKKCDMINQYQNHTDGEKKRYICQKPNTIDIFDIDELTDNMRKLKEDISNFNINFLFQEKNFRDKTIKYIIKKILEVGKQKEEEKQEEEKQNEEKLKIKNKEEKLKVGKPKEENSEVGKPKEEKLVQIFFDDYILLQILRIFEELRKTLNDRKTVIDLEHILEQIQEDEDEEEDARKTDLPNKEDILKQKNQNNKPQKLNSITIMNIVIDHILNINPVENIQEAKLNIFSESKMLFAEFIYIFFYHPLFDKYNLNDLNRSTIANMNLYQRFIYIHKFENFCNIITDYEGEDDQNEQKNYVEYESRKLYCKKPEKKSEDQIKIQEKYVKLVVTMFDKLIDNLKENADLNLIQKSFEIYNSLVKNLIKRCLLDKEMITKYFEIVYKTLEKLGDDNAKHFSFQIIKSIYYVLLYNEDKITLNKYLKKKNDHFNFFFKPCDQNHLINKVFLKILHIQSRRITDTAQIKKKEKIIYFRELITISKPELENKKESENVEDAKTTELKKIERKKRIFKFDEYVKKTIYLFMRQNAQKKIETKNMPIDPIYRDILKEENIQEKIKNNINDNTYMKEIIKMMNQLSKCNKEYLTCNYENNAFGYYIKECDENLKKLNKIMQVIEMGPQIKTHVLFKDERLTIEIRIKIRDIKEAVKYTNLIQAVNVFIKIFADRKKYIQRVFETKEEKEKKEFRDELNSKYVTFLFKFIYMIIKDHENENIENLIFLNIFDAKSFMIAFEDQENYIDFIINVNRLFFGRINQSYKFENAGFIWKITKELILGCVAEEVAKEIIEEENDENVIKLKLNTNSKLKNIDKITLAMRIVLKMIRHCTLEDSYSLEFLALMRKKLTEIFGLSEIKRFFISEDFSNHTIQEFFYRLFRLYNLISCTDFKFFDLFPVALIEDEIKEIIEKTIKKKNLELKVYYAMKEFLAHQRYYIIYDIKSTRLTNLFRYPEQFTEFKNKYYFNKENLNLANLANYNKIRNNTYELKDSFKEHFHLDQINEKIEEFTKEYLNDQDFKMQLDKSSDNESKIQSIRYFENAMLRPAFSLINQLLFKAANIKGRHKFFAFEMIKALMECFKIFINFFKNCLKNSSEARAFDSINFENQELLFFSQNKIMNDLEEIEKSNWSENKYFLFKDNANKFFNLLATYTKNEYKKVGFMKDYIEYKENSEDTSTTGENTSEIVDKVNAEEENNLVEYLIRYFSIMLEDRYSLVDVEFDEKQINQEKEKTTNFENKFHSTNCYKFSHLYCFNIINRLFLLDYQAIQSIFQTVCQKDDKQFMLFLKNSAIYNMYSLSVHESIKFYEIKRPHPKENFTLNIVNDAVKFFQNLCEGQNGFFQNVFLEKFKVYNIENFDEEDFEVFNINKEHFYNLKKRYFNDKALVKQYSKKIEPEKENNVNEKDNNVNRINELIKSIISNKEEPILSNEKSNETEKSKPYEEKETETMFSFMNFLFVNLKLMIYNSNFTTISYKLINKNEITDDSGLKSIRKGMEYLLLEVVQGAKESLINVLYNGSNFDKIKISDFFKIYENEDVENYSFLKYLIEIRNLYNHMLNNENDKNYRTIVKTIHKCFIIINTIIGQQKKKNNQIYLLIKHIFPLESLVSTSVFLMSQIYKKYLKKEEDKEDKEDNEDILVFNEEMKNIMNLFKCQSKEKESPSQSKILFKDPIFKLSAEIFLFITIISEQFEDKEARDLLKAHVEENAEDKSGETNKDTNVKNADFYTDNNVSKIKISSKKVAHVPMKQTTTYSPPKLGGNYDDEFKRQLQKKNICENKKHQTILFFMSLIKKIEFIIKNREGSTSNKIIYFLVNPKTYLISDVSIDSFFKNVDRTSPMTKLKSLISEISVFRRELEIKEESILDQSKKDLEFNYEKVHITNFSLGCLINLIILLFLKDDNFVYTWYHNLILFLSLFQIGYNLYYIHFNFSKKFEYIKEFEIERYKLKSEDFKKNHLESKKLTWKDFGWKDWKEVYLWKIILQEDMALLYFNMVILICCLLNKDLLFLYPLLLFSILKYDLTIKEIVLAFMSSFIQIVEMIGFLAILIYFYANFGFFFMYDEFHTTLESGEQTNMCSSLLQCYVTYFNLGIRSGGGIGDVIGMKAYSEGGWFWLRWISDMIFYITVLLLIMNMINGIIITTFSARRQVLEENKEDQEKRCFICSRNIMKFLAKQIDFKAHIKKEHNFKDYIRYFLFIYLTKDTDLDADQHYIKNCIENNDIAFFPVVETLYISGSNAEDEDEGNQGKEANVEDNKGKKQEALTGKK